METPKIIGIASYTVPTFGNTHANPYGKLTVSFKGERFTREIKEHPNGRQYITVLGRKYFVQNIGSLYSPKFALVNWVM